MATTDSLAHVTPLAAVEIVCRHARNGGLDGMRDIVQLISDFADCSVTPFWSLPRASEQRDLRLMQRLAARESSTMDKHHRAFLFNNALVHAVEVAASREENNREHGMAMIEWLCTSYCPRAFATKGMVEAVRYGDLEIIEWLVTHHKRVIWFDACGSAAASGGHLHVLQWLHTHNVLSSEWIHDALPEACANGDRASVQYLLSLGANNPNLSMCLAAVHGHLDIVKLLAGTFELGAYSATDVMYRAAGSNELAILEWLSAELSTANVPLMVNHAASNGHLRIVQWLHKDCSERCTTRAMDSAARLGYLQIVEWLDENCSAGCTTDAMDGAAQNGHLDVVQWLHVHRNEGCTTDAMHSATQNGHLDIVEWLHANRNEGCTTQAMDDAARIGRLDIIKWLHENRSEGCTTQAMDSAAQNGHLDVVQWLAENRSEGCTPVALTMAAANGHFVILQWLHARYDKDCTANALALAAEGGHLDVVQWLYTTFRHFDLTSGAIDAARTLEVLEWLHAHGFDGCTSSALDSDLALNNFDKLAFVRSHFPDIMCSTYGPFLAMGNDSIEAFLWLDAHFPELVDLPQVRHSNGEHHWTQVFDIVEHARSSRKQRCQ